MSYNCLSSNIIVSISCCCRFCTRHGPSQVKQQTKPPADLLAIAEALMPRLLLRLIQHLRDNSAMPDPVDGMAIDAAESYLNFLHSLSDMGAAMRKVITKAMTNPQKYHSLISGTNTLLLRVMVQDCTWHVSSQIQLETCVRL